MRDRSIPCYYHTKENKFLICLSHLSYFPWSLAIGIVYKGVLITITSMLSWLCVWIFIYLFIIHSCALHRSQKICGYILSSVVELNGWFRWKTSRENIFDVEVISFRMETMGDTKYILLILAANWVPLGPSKVWPRQGSNPRSMMNNSFSSTLLGTSIGWSGEARIRMMLVNVLELWVSL